MVLLALYESHYDHLKQISGELLYTQVFIVWSAKGPEGKSGGTSVPGKTANWGVFVVWHTMFMPLCVATLTVCALLRDCRSVSSWPYLAHPLTCTTVAVHGLAWWQIECMLCPFKSPSLYIVCVLWWKLERGRKEEAGMWRSGGCEGGVGGGEGRGTGGAKSCDSCGLSLSRGEPTLMSWGQRKPRLSLKRTMTWVCSPMLVFVVQNNSFRCEFEVKQDHCGSSVYSNVLCCGVHYSLHSQ